MNKEYYINKYRELKGNLGRTPKIREFYEIEGVTKGAFQKCFGNNPYSKMQELSGDTPNRLEIERTPINEIFEKFGEVTEKLGKTPTQADWAFFDCKPTVSGIEKGPHKIRWSELPSLFYTYALEAKKWEKAKSIIENLQSPAPKADKVDYDFQNCINKIKGWVPQRKRFNEEGYKIELRNFLSNNKFKVAEEIGDSNIDLLINNKIGIEIKKDPTTSEYDRLIGQIVRHLMKFDFLIVVIINNSNYDRHQEFLNAIEFMSNGSHWQLEIINK